MTPSASTSARPLTTASELHARRRLEPAVVQLALDGAALVEAELELEAAALAGRLGHLGLDQRRRRARRRHRLGEHRALAHLEVDALTHRPSAVDSLRAA